MVGNKLQDAPAVLAQNATGFPVRVLPFDDAVSNCWDHFVFEQASGSMFHLSRWKRAIEKTFAYRARYLYAQRDGRITGVAPVFLVSNWIMGKALISAPFAAYGGICSEDEESATALIAELEKIGHEEQVDFIEVRTRNGRVIPGFHPNSRYVTFSTELHPNVEANLKRLPRDTRYMIRKAQKFGLRVQHGLEQLHQFYELHAISLRRLGTPVFPKAMFENFIEEFRDSVDLMLVYSGSVPLTGVFSFLYRDTILPYYAGAAPDAGKLAANNLMYWELMRFAVEKGLKVFDFGRSKVGTGAYAFKSQWDMEPEPLAYQVSLLRRKSKPNFSPANPKFGLAARLWSRIPLRASMLLGPHIVRWFP
jgi:FemAB-related protein (PEP-CTERM system-associated)